MKYRFSITVVGSLVAALCLIAFGWLMGKQADSTSFITIAFQWLVDIGTILAGLGTLCAAYVGFLALSAWKVQSKGQSNIARLIECQEALAVLCVELLPTTVSLPPEKRNELYSLFERLLVNLAVLSRTSAHRNELQSIRQSLLLPSYLFRDYGVIWPPNKEKLMAAEEQLIRLIESW
ncbi:TPA: hypothetical protein ACNUQ9_003531 [Vibrio cholerae]|uniref:hypothetical protein n=1 Tax=Vibrio cholerae TaxID=666 RepID=UPI0012EB93BC|nr:hypothetical protein [Vibrio cholerae]EGR1129987.1 hypothetical protein [Vibrio cholerae]EGR4332880.1 hypothetical protein [Vibrio cholerae]EJL6307537.1 hypothetical protein [Vibrio cholerae]EJL6542856.1 hypothetical protein [Vibrio cholerae]EJL6677194.1 hypothetical protein [Vibrio cholerae]